VGNRGNKFGILDVFGDRAVQIKEDNLSLGRALVSLDGLSVGDSFGEKFFLHPNVVENIVAARAIPALPWYYTDDTEMALSIVAILRKYGQIDQDELAQSFAHRYNSDRSYGRAMHGLLEKIRNGEPWLHVASALFDGQGSYGNGAAMRVAPLGAFFADDLDLLVSEARKSAEITHSHPEAIAGAIAVSLAAAFACKLYTKATFASKGEFLEQIIPLVLDSEVKSQIIRASNLAENTSVHSAAQILGNGTHVSAQDTVPFSLWCAAQHLDSYEKALWLTVSGLGDRDTTCAIVGGIVALSAGRESIPSEWLKAREALP
jgi:ADP-ribosylglycohydrolase